MERQSIRFRPPRVALDARVNWVLVRAFGPVKKELSEAIGHWDPEAALRLAGQLGLAGRIAARQPHDLLVQELGEEAATSLRAHRLAVSAADLRLDGVAEAVARAAAERGVAIAFVKGYALRLLGVVAEGGRGSADLDVLAPEGQGAGLQAALVEAGFQPSDSREREHQWPALIHPSGGVVEVHRLLLGVRVGSSGASRREGRSATLDDLSLGDLLVEAPPLPGRPAWPRGCSIPRHRLLVAHLLVHGMAQHGWEPHGYPAFKMIADLIDLGAAGREKVDDEWPWVLAAVGEELTASEVEVARRLAGQLAAGDLSAAEADPEKEGCAALLHHLLAGALDEEYCRSLRFRLIARPLTDRGAAGGFLAVVRRTVVPTRAELGRIHGQELSRVGYLGRLALRPADLLLRAGRYALSALRLRSR